MSWTPDFWVRKEDFIPIRDKVFAVGEEVQCWEFKIAGRDGVVISCGEFSSTHRDLHDVIEKVDHWILTSEPSCCINGEEWGDEIDRYTYKEKK